MEEGRRALRPEHDRHPRPRRLHLRGVPQPRGLRGRRAAGRRRPGHRGADAGQPVPGDQRRPQHHPGAEQDRPPGRPARAVRRGAGGHHRLRPERGAAGLGQDRRGRRGAAQHHRRPGPAPGRRPRRARPGADLRLGLRHLPRRRHLRAGGRRQAQQARADADDVDPERPRDPGTRRDLARADPVRRPRGGRGRLRHLGREGRPPGPGGRHHHDLVRRGQGTAGGLLAPQADGVLRPLPGRRRRVPGAARRAGQAPAQRRRPGLRAGDVAPRSASASAAASSACCTWRSSASGSSASSTCR